MGKKLTKIGDKFYDFETSNESFLLTAAELKTLGIKNWYQCLEVRFPNLGVQDLNPYDPDLSTEDIAKIIMECKHNIWYYIREVARIPVAGAPTALSVCLTRASHAVIWCFNHSIDFMLSQPRQTYKTTICLVISNYCFLFEYKNTKIPFLHMKEKDVLRNTGMFRDYIIALPKYLNPWADMNKLPGTKSLRYTKHNTELLVYASADNEQKATDMLRGNTLFSLLGDEWEFIPYIDSLISGASPAIISGRTIARQTGCRTCIMLLSTPGDLNTDAGKAAGRMIEATPRFSEKYYDMNDDELNESLTYEIGGIKQQISRLYIEFNYRQLRKDDKWLAEQYQEAINTGKVSEYERGVLLKRFRGGDTILFRQCDIDYIQTNFKEPDNEIFVLNKYHLYCYNHLKRKVDLTSDTPYFDITIPYLIGIDVAAGCGGDNTAIIVVHPYTLEIVAELKSPLMGTIDLMRVITKLAIIIPRGLFCLESNSLGKTIVEFIQESQLESRFFHDPKLDIAKNVIERNNDVVSSLAHKSKQRGYIGTYVNSTVRNNMFDLLKRHMRDYHHLITGRYVVEDICKLVLTKSGKIAAETGEHDDCIMAYLHILYVLHYGSDLGRFGIDKNLCTFEKCNEVLKEFEQAVDEHTVNNMIPYDGQTMYEGQVLNDIVNSRKNFGNNDVDIYGYKRNQYGGDNIYKQNDSQNVSISDLSFFYDVNQNIY